MKQPNLPLQHSKPQSIRLSLSCLLLAGFVLCPSFVGAPIRAAEMLEEISNSKLADPNVKSTLGVLRSQIGKTIAKLPPGLQNEFEQSIAARLKRIQESVSHNISTEYKSALMAKRILELSENVMTLPYRKVPVDVRQRKLAQEQYAAVLNRFEKAAQDRVKDLDELSRPAITGALRQPLTDVQKDIFQPGYGRPLTDGEKTELNRIVDGMLQAASGLPAASEKKATEPRGLRAAANVANDGRQAVLAWLRGREAALVHDSLFVSASRAWHRENITIAQTVDRNLQTADQAEISAVIARAAQQEKTDLEQNDPKRIAAIAAAVEVARNRPAPFSSRIVTASLLLIIVTVPLFLISLRRKAG